MSRVIFWRQKFATIVQPCLKSLFTLTCGVAAQLSSPQPVPLPVTLLLGALPSLEEVITLITLSSSLFASNQLGFLPLSHLRTFSTVRASFPSPPTILSHILFSHTLLELFNSEDHPLYNTQSSSLGVYLRESAASYSLSSFIRACDLSSSQLHAILEHHSRNTIVTDTVSSQCNAITCCYIGSCQEYRNIHVLLQEPRVSFPTPEGLLLHCSATEATTRTIWLG